MVKKTKRLALAVVAVIMLTISLMGLYYLLDIQESEVDVEQYPFPPLLDVSKTVFRLPQAVTDRTPVAGTMSIEYGKEKKEYGITASKRGSSSYLFSKPQYSLSLIGEDGVEVSRSIMDMPSGEDWVLNGPFIDKTMIRNYLGYSVAFDIMGYAPRLQFTELHHEINGVLSYRGLYAWTEKIRRDNHKVKISASLQGYEETSFIVKRDTYRIGDTLLKVYGKELYLYPNEMLQVYPRVNLTDAQRNYTEDTISLFERNLYHDNYDVEGLGYEEYADLLSFVDFVIINEFFMNTDAGIKSTYFYKDARGKLMAGPVWDFNNAMGNVNFNFEMYDYKGFFMHQRAWFDRLLNDKKFVGILIDRYKHLRRLELSDDVLQSKIDEAMSVLSPFIERDQTLYTASKVNVAYRGFLGLEDMRLADHMNQMLLDEHHLPTEVSRLKNFITKRGQWMDENIDSLLKWVDQ
ncbi:MULTISPECIES: CotH kinase family protein [unclassified Fusibacter]|uniref:CotH kinase family protein n=1 Tax=unclassified Fusibacter TaxID=2624464 RepID=UPI00101109B9|nr:MULTISPECIES: CotH kinase family protein [unclassified Fusibacter]MCK8059604.1 CotH kinase family protein [Fusibacter sp. A2]NPE21405.1 spore coat protein CotH [Fusibacter sp. A1]RXV61820.1 spore coat protein CotH [Fusibacter sp. A1]